MPGPMILGRIQAKAMGYIQFPQNPAVTYFKHVPTCFKKFMYKQDTHNKDYQDCISTPSLTTQTLKDATSGYWHVVLDLDSSLLTTFNTPWGKFRWLRLPFGLKIASDVFQE